MPKIWNKYSQKRNIGASVPISIFMCLWAIYIFPWSICLFCCRKYVVWSWEYINCSPTHECENWDWGRAISRKGIHKWNFRCSVLCVYYYSVQYSLFLFRSGDQAHRHLCQQISWRFHILGQVQKILRHLHFLLMFYNNLKFLLVGFLLYITI